MIDAQDRSRRAVLTLDEALGQIDRLAALNARGADVLVRPATGLASGLVVIDDLTAVGRRRLREDGHVPVVVTRTPDGRAQAWIRLTVGAIDPRVAAEAARLLQGRYALTDDLAHLGRLAGFTDHTAARPARGEREAPARTVVQAVGAEPGRVTPAAQRIVAEARERVAAQEHVPQRDRETHWDARLATAFADESTREEPSGMAFPDDRRRRRIGRADERGGRGDR